ncbi:MAG: ImmA/IrrE family metallo-endopeptidase [Bacteroidetes bacterium]|nr:ImmA/IrrE family metallo-endopeptidase [Bacteroidota bacterium]
MMTLTNQYSPDIVFHPATTLNEKLKEMGMSRKEFALRTGKPEKTIIAVLKEESSLTPEMAILFETVTQIPAQFWINKQARYNEYIARKKHEEAITQASEWAKQFPYAEMAKHKWVISTRNAKEKTINLLNYFGVASHSAWEKLYIETRLKVAAYTSLKQSHQPHAISAWLRQGELQAKQTDAPVFDVKKLKSNIPAMRQLMVEQPVDFFKQLQIFCLNAGVILLFTPKLPKVPLSGSTRWLNNTPLIQLTARYKKNDNFWFTFFHELGHIILHGKKYISLENIDFAAADPEKEEEAHQFAVALTFTNEQEKELLENKTITEQDIINYAKKFNTHPAMIIGRLQHDELIPYSVGRQFMESIDLSSL